MAVNILVCKRAKMSIFMHVRGIMYLQTYRHLFFRTYQSFDRQQMIYECVLCSMYLMEYLIYTVVYVRVVWLLYYSLTYPKIANFLFEYGGQNHGTASLRNTKCLLSSQKCTWRHSGKTRLTEHSRLIEHTTTYGTPTAFVTHHDLWNTIQLIEHNTIRGTHHTTT